MNFSGRVVKGSGLGYKTANLAVDDHGLLKALADGVYLAKVFYQNREYPALGIKGMRQDFEARLLGFEGDLYGRVLKVEIIKKLRKLVKFETEAELLKQIDEDIQKAKQYFKLN